MLRKRLEALPLGSTISFLHYGQKRCYRKIRKPNGLFWYNAEMNSCIKDCQVPYNFKIGGK